MMTRAQLKRFIAECVILLLVSTVLIFTGYMVSSAKSDIRVQISASRTDSDHTMFFPDKLIKDFKTVAYYI